MSDKEISSLEATFSLQNSHAAARISRCVAGQPWAHEVHL